MLCTDQAIVLKASQHTSSSLILKVFTHDYGVISMFVRMNSNQRKTLKSVLLPMQIVEITFFKKEEKLSTFKELGTVYHDGQLESNISRNAAFTLMSEVLLNSLKEHQLQVRFYDQLRDLIINIHQEKTFSLHLCFFMFRVFDALGVQFFENKSFLAEHIENQEILETLYLTNQHKFAELKTAINEKQMFELLVIYYHTYISDRSLLSLEVYREVFYN